MSDPTPVIANTISNSRSFSGRTRESLGKVDAVTADALGGAVVMGAAVVMGVAVSTGTVFVKVSRGTVFAKDDAAVASGATGVISGMSHDEVIGDDGSGDADLSVAMGSAIGPRSGNSRTGVKNRENPKHLGGWPHGAITYSLGSELSCKG